MRPAFAASAFYLGLLVLAAYPATPQTPAPAPAPTPPATMSPAAVQVANDAAARHARRTACLKDAKAKKLIGADKTAFLKTCLDTPPDAIAASRIP